MSQCIVALGLIVNLFHPPVPNIEQFPTGRREGEVKKVFVELEQAVAEIFTPNSVTNFGNHVVSNDRENNQTFINENEVHFVSMHGEILFGTNVKMHIYINFMQQSTAVYENTYGQLLMNGCIVAHRFF